MWLSDNLNNHWISRVTQLHQPVRHGFPYSAHTWGRKALGTCAQSLCTGSENHMSLNHQGSNLLRVKATQYTPTIYTALYRSSSNRSIHLVCHTPHHIEPTYQFTSSHIFLFHTWTCELVIKIVHVIATPCSAVHVRFHHLHINLHVKLRNDET